MMYIFKSGLLQKFIVTKFGWVSFGDTRTAFEKKNRGKI